MTTITAAALDPTKLIIAVLVGLVILLLLIIKFKVQAMISILVDAVAIGLIAGMPFTDIISSVNEGVGSTLKGIALFVGLGPTLGSILEISGGARILAITMVKKFGDKKAVWASGITGLVVAMSVFLDAGFVILIPPAFSLAKRAEHSSLFYAIPLLAGLAIGHALVPPTPGPVLVATMLGVDLGWVIMVGIVCDISATIVAGPIWRTICGNKYDIPVPEHIANQEDFDESKLPKFGTIVGIILILLVLIILNSITKVVPVLASVQPVLGFLGEPFVVPTIAAVVATPPLGYRHGYSNEESEKVLTKSLESTGLILLVTVRGGVLWFMLQNSGSGDVIGNVVSPASLLIVVVALAVAALARISIGSATVAMTTAAGIVAATSEIATLSPLHLVCIAAAMAGEATVCFYFNGSGFWFAESLVGLDKKTTLKIWITMEMLVGDAGFVVILIISFFV